MAKNGNPFSPAALVQKKLKVLAYGQSGTGKTRLALTFPGPIAVIDTEGGTELYGGREGIQPFDVIRTKSYEEVMAALDFIEADGGKTYQTVVIDPITVLWQVLIESASRVRSLTTADGALSNRGWGLVKNRVNALYVRLVNLPVHVVVTSRLKDEYAKKDGELIKVGVKPDAEKSTDYLFDVVLRLDRRQGRRWAVVEKVRGHDLPQTIDNIAYTHLAPLAQAQEAGQKVERVADGDVIESEAQTIVQEEQAAQQAQQEKSAGENGSQEDLPLPDSHMCLCDMEGKDLYAIQKMAPDMLSLHPKHFENRWKKRFGVRSLKEIPATTREFMKVMAQADIPEEGSEPEATRGTLDEHFGPKQQIERHLAQRESDIENSYEAA